MFIPVKNTIISGDSSLPFQFIRIVFKSFCNMFPLTQQMLRSLNPFSANLFFVSALCRYLFLSFYLQATLKPKQTPTLSETVHPNILGSHSGYKMKMLLLYAHTYATQDPRVICQGKLKALSPTRSLFLSALTHTYTQSMH